MSADSRFAVVFAGTHQSSGSRLERLTLRRLGAPSPYPVVRYSVATQTELLGLQEGPP
jgi:hypothetical protein